MEPLSTATTFATIVGLLGNFVAERRGKATATYEEFTEWLLRSNHQDLVNLISQSDRTLISVKALLNLQQEELVTRLQSLDESLAHIATGFDELRDLALAIYPSGHGGEGGGGTIVGNRGTVIGGRGGNGGASGSGGKGGSGFIQGDDGLIIGGDGGDSGTADGRGGRGARGPTERLGFSTSTWGFGRGGTGRNHPEYDRRVNVLREVRNEYISKFPLDAPFIEAGIDQVPTDWVNQRLTELGEPWRVQLGHDGYVLPNL